MKLYIKYELCVRCKKEMEDELDKLGLHYGEVGRGKLEISEDVNYEQLVTLETALIDAGLELKEDKKALLIRKIKDAIEEKIQNPSDQHKTIFSVYLSEKLKYDYPYLSGLFSEVTGITIEHYIITRKIERVKQLLLDDEMNLTEIAHLLNYSSVAHLSNQFKKITGVSPSFFKHLKVRKMPV